MPDYLAGIVARSTGATAPVRPRVPTLFEPMGFAVADTVAAPERGDRPPRRDEPREPASRPDRTTGELRLKDRHGAPERAAPPPVTARAVAEPVDVITRSERPPAPVTPPVAPPPPAPPPPPAAPLSPSVPEQRAVQSREDKPAAPPVQVVRRAEPEVAPRLLDGLERRLRAIVEEVLAPDRPSAPPILAPPSRESPPLVRDAPLRPRPPAAETGVAVPPTRRAEPSSGETLVHVRIGRVDVRAPAAGEPAPPARARVRRQPPTRLEEYLGRRNGTRR